jgi:hypothetical protein
MPVASPLLSIYGKTTPKNFGAEGIQQASREENMFILFLGIKVDQFTGNSILRYY